MTDFLDRKNEQELELLAPAEDGEKWPCGHPKTPKNTQHIGAAGNRCRCCRRRLTRESWRRKHQHGGV